jgi:hypothetical protein
MLTSNAPLTIVDIGLLLEGLTAAASAHRGPKSAMVLKKEAARALLVGELQALQAEMLQEMGITLPAPAESASKAHSAPSKDPKPAKTKPAAPAQSAIEGA